MPISLGFLGRSMSSMSSGLSRSNRRIRPVERARIRTLLATWAATKSEDISKRSCTRCTSKMGREGSKLSCGTILTPAAMQYDFTNEGGVGGAIRFLQNFTGLWLLQACQQQWQREGASYSWEQLMAAAQDAPAFGCLVDPDAHDFFAPGNMPAAIRAWAIARRIRQAWALATISPVETSRPDGSTRAVSTANGMESIGIHNMLEPSIRVLVTGATKLSWRLC